MAHDSSSQGRVPAVSAALTWLVPGAGHVYVGRPLLGLVAFVLIEGLYYAGWKLAGGMTFEFLDPELRSRFATVLAPEVGNLGAFVLHMRHAPFGLGWPTGYMPRPYPDTVMLGSLLSALSGIGNACLMAHAHLLARDRAPAQGARPGARARTWPPAVLALLAWLVPGLGHWLQGRRLRGVLVLVLLVGLFALGTFLAEGSNLSRERHFYFWSGQLMLGLPAVAVELASGRPPVTGDIAWADAGLTYACIAGLLNVLAVLDVHAWAEDVWCGREPLPRGESVASVPETP